MSKKKTWKEDLKGIVGLEYITFRSVPMKDSDHGPVIDAEPGTLEKLASQAIITHRVPIRGLELKFLRKTLGLSLEKFAGKLGLTSAAIFKWEHEPSARLHPMNEVAVRSLIAELMKIEISGHFSDLVATNKNEPDPIELKAS